MELQSVKKINGYQAPMFANVYMVEFVAEIRFLKTCKWSGQLFQSGRHSSFRTTVTDAQARMKGGIWGEFFNMSQNPGDPFAVGSIATVSGQQGFLETERGFKAASDVFEVVEISRTQGQAATSSEVSEETRISALARLKRGLEDWYWRDVLIIATMSRSEGNSKRSYELELDDLTVSSYDIRAGESFPRPPTLLSPASWKGHHGRLFDLNREDGKEGVYVYEAGGDWKKLSDLDIYGYQLDGRGKRLVGEVRGGMGAAVLDLGTGEVLNLNPYEHFEYFEGGVDDYFWIGDRVLFESPGGLATWAPGAAKPEESPCKGAVVASAGGRVLHRFGHWDYNPRRLPRGLVWCDVETGETERLSAREDGLIAVSPDDRSVAILRHDQVLVTLLSGEHIHKLDIGEVLGVTPHAPAQIGWPPNPRPHLVEWSPDGRWVAFGLEVSESTSGDSPEELLASLEAPKEYPLLVLDTGSGALVEVEPDSARRVAWVTLSRHSWFSPGQAWAAIWTALLVVGLSCIVLLAVMGTRRLRKQAAA